MVFLIYAIILGWKSNSLPSYWPPCALPDVCLPRQCPLLLLRHVYSMVPSLPPVNDYMVKYLHSNWKTSNSEFDSGGEWGPKELRGQESHSRPVVAKTSAGLWEGRWGSIVTQSSMQVSDLNEVTLSTKSYVSDSRNEKLKMERRGPHQIVYYMGNRSLAQGTLILGSDSPSSMTNRVSGWFS